MYLTQGLHRSVQQKPDVLATVFGGRRQTWRQMMERISRLAAGLVGLGMERGDRVAIIALNSDRYIETYYAVAWAGAVLVPGNTRWVLQEHIYALRDAEAKFLIVDKAFASLAASVNDACALAATVYLDDGVAPTGFTDSEALIRAATPLPDGCGMDEELAMIFYTGGTTGRPKGVMLSHRNIVSNVLCVQATSPAGNEPVFLHAPPMFHLADAGTIFRVTMQGGTHVVIPFFSPEDVVRAIQAERVTEILLVPTMFRMLRDYVGEKYVDLSSVTHVLYGASPISETLLRQAMELFPNAAFRQAYGQTELSPGATILQPEFHRPSATGKSYLRSAGRALIGVDVRIVDETMVDRPVGEVGEIIVRGDGVMLGYWKQPELTRQTVVNGWMRTGDAGYLDAEGFLYLADRLKDMIVSGGENVYSAEVENAICTHRKVVECAVFGVPDDKWGERVHAVVRLIDDCQVSVEELISHCRDLIAGYKVPRSVELRREPLPLSGAGKILKSELRKPYWSGGKSSAS